jgi:GDPmannose 4,6-dehydratase
MAKTAIITGITGQDGAYLSSLLLGKKYKIIGLVRRDAEESFFGLNYLKILDKVKIEKCNLLDFSDIENVFRRYQPSEVYNLAAQSSVGLSFRKPFETINFNVLSVLNLLEITRKEDKKIRFYQASTSDMFGNIEKLPVTEESVIHPASPYGISKAAGHWMAVNYRESYDLFACCGILFNHESYLRAPNFFVKKVIRESLEIKNGTKGELRVGNIDLRRDFGYAPDYVKAMWLMLQKNTPKDYIVCSGESISLREIIEYVFKKLGIRKDKIVIDKSFFRPNDIENIYGVNEKAKKELGWEYEKTFFEVLDILIKEEMDNFQVKK